MRPPTAMAASTPSHGAYQTRALAACATAGASISWAVTAAASAPKRMMPSRAMLTTPERSLNRPPSAANRRGVVARSMDETRARSSTVSISGGFLGSGDTLLIGVVLGGAALGAHPGARVEEALRQEAPRGDEQHHQREDHAHDLAREVGEGDVEHRAAVLQDPEQERRGHDEDRLVGAEQRHRDAVEAVVGGDRLAQRSEE